MDCIRFVRLSLCVCVCVCVCVYIYKHIKMNTFALLTVEAWRKNDVEVVEYTGERWINQKHLQK